MYNEEVQEELAELFIKNGLPMGRLIYPTSTPCRLNTVLSTVEDGPFWYGDLDSKDVETVDKISTQIGKSILMVNND